MKTSTQDLEQIIQGRKSIRKYKPDPIPKEILERILNAGLHAPSGKNRQNWRFFVVQGKKRDAYLKLSQKSWLGIQPILEKRLKPSLYAFTERFFYTLGDAPTIVFCYSLNDPEERYLTSIGSVYMAVQNMILMATSLGLGTCPMGAPLEIENEVNEFLEISKVGIPPGAELQLLCALVLGYPDHEPPKANRQTVNRITWID